MLGVEDLHLHTFGDCLTKHLDLLEGRYVRIRSLDRSGCSITWGRRDSPPEKKAEALAPNDFHSLLTFLDYLSSTKETFRTGADLAAVSWRDLPFEWSSSWVPIPSRQQ